MLKAKSKKDGYVHYHRDGVLYCNHVEEVTDEKYDHTDEVVNCILCDILNIAAKDFRKEMDKEMLEILIKNAENKT